VQYLSEIPRSDLQHGKPSRPASRLQQGYKICIVFPIPGYTKIINWHDITNKSLAIALRVKTMMSPLAVINECNPEYNISGLWIRKITIYPVDYWII
jgi:hypothetical protein